MKILLTGCGGQLGREVAGLLNKGSNAGYDAECLGSAALDITDREKVLAAVARVSPGVIINCAAYTRVDDAENERDRAFAVNRDGPGNLAEAALEAGARLVHISTDFVFDGRKTTPYKETDPTGPLGVYGASKLAGEEEIARRLKEHVIVRTSWLYGQGGKNFVHTILKLAEEREELRVVNDQMGSPTWTYDLAGAVKSILKRISGDADGEVWGIYNYSNEGAVSWHGFASAIIEEAGALGAPVKCRSVVPIPGREYPTPAPRPAFSVLDTGKIKKTFSITIPHWRASLKRMISGIYGGVYGGEHA
jgi:dTDP-4-dehydrorhamnose reductase